ncbi:hypothetical protein CL634_05100 [bacterium]|nr:hypothetical protein [bacterium]
MIKQISERLGYVLTKNANDPDIKFAVKWETKGVGLEEYEYSYSGLIINNHTVNIAKTVMGNSFEKIFGYNINIDPKKYEGLAVQKGQGNARHNGKLVKCPVKHPRVYSFGVRACYQIYIDWKTEDGLYCQEYRIPFIGGKIPLVYLKKKTEEQRWLAGCSILELLKVSEAFSEEELIKINEFCAEINLDYGELDILRDPASNKIYIIDVNNAPFGPPSIISPEDKEHALNEIAFYFRKNLIEKEH